MITANNNSVGTVSGTLLLHVPRASHFPHRPGSSCQCRSQIRSLRHNIATAMKHSTPFRFVLLSVFCASFACAQEPPADPLQEATPPAGVVKGFVKTGNREGVFIIGGSAVFPGETFSVTTRGVKVIWKVLDVSAGKARFARAVADAAGTLAPPPDCTPNYAAFLKVLQQGAEAHKAASTSVQKEQILAATRASAKLWCASNTVFCIQGIVTDLTMIDDQTAQLRLTDSEESDALKHNLFVSGPLRINIPLSRKKALGYKAGYHVRLCGRPFFIPGSDSLLVDGATRNRSFASFMMLHGAATIGSLQLFGPRFEIYDPKNETVR